MILDIDAGNSSVKWQLITADNKLLEQGRLDPMQSKTWFDRGWEEKLLSVRVSNVAGQSMAERIRQQLAGITSVEPRFARVQQDFAGLHLCYQEPERLGVDRWLAMLAARKRCSGAFIVVDSGSALTADYVDARGWHQGGYIVPGFPLLHAALYQGTADVKVSEVVGDGDAWGINTEQAVNNGLSRMLRSFVQNLADELRRQTGETCLFVTGGDGASLVLPQTDGITLCYEPDLVMAGLAEVFPAGEH